MPTPPAAAPPPQTATISKTADQGARAAAAKTKGFQQAIYAGDTGGWKPISLLGKPSQSGPKPAPGPGGANPWGAGRAPGAVPGAMQPLSLFPAKTTLG